MTEQILFHKDTTLVRRLVLEPGEAMPWHRDPYQRVSILLRGDALLIENLHGGESERIALTPGLVDWDMPYGELHRGVNVGEQTYEEVTVFFLDRPDAVHQPTEQVEDKP